ncbi:MAG: hypothetical protein Q8N63_02960 [Nanoarchaeota archaeon]|nr:hypothetical protein [Nanoarchaeota archaeon]
MKNSLSVFQAIVILLVAASLMFVFGRGIYRSVSYERISEKETEIGAIDKSLEFDSFQKEPNFSSAGVFVYYHNSKGWVQNTNNFPVRIDGTTIIPTGEHSKWLLTFEPGQIKLVYIKERDRFYIYELSGKPIGTIFVEKVY